MQQPPRPVNAIGAFRRRYPARSAGERVSESTRRSPSSMKVHRSLAFRWFGSEGDQCPSSAAVHTSANAAGFPAPPIESRTVMKILRAGCARSRARARDAGRRSWLIFALRTTSDSRLQAAAWSAPCRRLDTATSTLRASDVRRMGSGCPAGPNLSASTWAAVCPVSARGRSDARRRRNAIPPHGCPRLPVEQFSRAVEPLVELKFRQLEYQLRPVRRRVVARKGVKSPVAVLTPFFSNSRRPRRPAVAGLRRGRAVRGGQIGACAGRKKLTLNGDSFGLPGQRESGCRPAAPFDLAQKTAA